ncbi:MAG TPA: hypothetical protein P5096_03965 [Patescibacteria group bacterium]|nr:hypothetical protein [Patescibacteria group bacterium]
MNSENQKGIALIITIMLSAIMLTTVFVASREMIDETRNSTRIDNSLIAYYAAESGLEDALLQYRYSKDTEINNPPRCWNIDADTAVTSGCSETWTPNSSNYNNRLYKVKMWYKVSSINDPIILNKDDVLEISLPANSSVDFKWSDVNTIPSINRMGVEISTYDLNDTTNIETKFVDPINNTQAFSATGSSKIVRIKPWYITGPPSSPTGATMPTDGSIPGILITNPLDTSKGITGTNFGGPTTFIESVGYFGGVQRKIVANIDRSSGQVLSIMDFVIYSGSDLVK